MPHTLRSDLVVEHIDNDVLVLDGKSSTVHRFTGSHAEAIKHLDAGENIEAFSTELADLDASGLLETEIEGSAVSRRGVLLGGSALAGSAALAMSMPGVASAQSAGGNIEIEEFTFEGVSRQLLTDSAADPQPWTARLQDLQQDIFEVDQEWTLRILGFSGQDLNGDFEPVEPLNPTLTTSATATEGDYGINFDFVFDNDEKSLPSGAGAYQFEVRLEKGNLRSEPFLVGT